MIDTIFMNGFMVLFILFIEREREREVLRVLAALRKGFCGLQKEVGGGGCR